jgi:hypothetical protein
MRLGRYDLDSEPATFRRLFHLIRRVLLRDPFDFCDDFLP